MANQSLLPFSSTVRNVLVGNCTVWQFTARQFRQFCKGLLWSGRPALLKNVDSSMFRCQLWYRLDPSAGCGNDIRLFVHTAPYSWWQDSFFFFFMLKMIKCRERRRKWCKCNDVCFGDLFPSSLGAVFLQMQRSSSLCLEFTFKQCSKVLVVCWFGK